MSNIVVNITREKATTQASAFGTALLIVKAAKDYKEYGDLDDILVDYATSDEEYKFANAYFSQNISPTKLAIAGVNYTAESEVAALLTTLVDEGRDFYAIATQETSDALYEVIDDWITTGDHIKILIIKTATVPASFVLTLGDRSFVYYHETGAEYPDAAVLGACLSKNPGSLSWNNQEILEVTSNDLTATELTALKNKRMNTIILKYGSVATEGGFMYTTLFIDQRRSQDYVKVTMENNIGALLIKVDKLPYDDRGIAQVVSVVESTLNVAFDNGVIAAKGDGKTPEFVVNYLTRAQIQATDPQAIIDRILRSVTFQYVEAGAIESVIINGKIVAEL